MATSLEFLEQLDALFFSNTRTGIPNPDPDMIWPVARTQYTDHDLTFGGITQSIANKVLDNPANPLWIGVNPELGIMYSQFDATLCRNGFELQFQIT